MHKLQPLHLEQHACFSVCTEDLDDAQDCHYITSTAAVHQVPGQLYYAALCLLLPCQLEKAPVPDLNWITKLQHYCRYMLAFLHSVSSVPVSEGGVLLCQGLLVASQKYPELGHKKNEQMHAQDARLSLGEPECVSSASRCLAQSFSGE